MGVGEAGGCCSKSEQSVVNAQGAGDWVTWFFNHIEDFEQLVTIGGRIISDIPLGSGTAIAASAVTLQGVEASIQVRIAAEAKARGWTGERLRKFLDVAGPLIGKFLIPILLDQIKLAAVSLD